MHTSIPHLHSHVQAIKKFEGGVVLVSHDFRLLEQVTHGGVNRGVNACTEL